MKRNALLLLALFIVTLALLFFVPVLSAAQHGHGSSHGQASHAERGVTRGHGRNEGRGIDGHFRGEHFGRGNHIVLGGLYGRRSFVFGGVWFGLDVWPSFWYASDYVYVDYYDGDYFIVNERFPGQRVAIVIE